MAEKLPSRSESSGPDYKRDPKYTSKLRKSKNSTGTLDYPPQYNDAENSPDQIQFGDMESVDSGDPFAEVDVQENSNPFEHQDKPNPKSLMAKLRKKGKPE